MILVFIYISDQAKYHLYQNRKGLLYPERLKAIDPAY